MSILIAVLAVVFVLGIAINIHEFGHFIVAKLLGMRVDAYSFFGLGPRIWGFKIGHTDYRISAIPLGAYVKLYGDEGSGVLEGKDEQSEAVPDSELYELRPRWQKFLVMIGGPFMNLMLALAIPFSMALIGGVPVPQSPIVGVVALGGAADLAGIKSGDRIVAFEDKQDPTWKRIANDSALAPGKPLPITVERAGQRLSLTLTPALKVDESGNKMGYVEMQPESGLEPLVVEDVEPNSPAALAGIREGDMLISINGVAIRSPGEIPEVIKKEWADSNSPLKLHLSRGGQPVEVEAVPFAGAGGPAAAAASGTSQIRVGLRFSNKMFRARESVNIPEAAAYAWNTNMEILRMTGKAFAQVGRGERAAGDTFSGPIGIVQIISKVANSVGFEGLLVILGLISLNLGIFNLLPIPMLDGGQIAVLGIEGFLALFGVGLSDGIKNRIQMVGLSAILVLMVFTIFNDVMRFFR